MCTTLPRSEPPCLRIPCAPKIDTNLWDTLTEKLFILIPPTGRSLDEANPWDVPAFQADYRYLARITNITYCSMRFRVTFSTISRSYGILGHSGILLFVCGTLCSALYTNCRISRTWKSCCLYEAPAVRHGRIDSACGAQYTPCYV